MKTEVTTEAPSVEEAMDAALEELGVQQDAVQYEVLEEPSKSLFGMGGSKTARVRVWVRESYLKELEAADAGAKEDDVVPAEVIKASHDDQPELSDEELDRVADVAASALKGLLTRFGIEEPTIEEYEGDEGEIILDIMGGDLGILIGRHGRTLDALQTAVGAITTRSMGFRYPVIVDVEGYRHRRRQKIEDMAKRSADRAARQHIVIKMRPMTAYERRIVHVVLRNDARVTTGSEGAEPFRQVVITPKR